MREQSPGFDELNTEIERARLESLQLDKNRSAIKEKLDKKEKKKEKKKKKKHHSESESDAGTNKSTNMSEVEAEGATAAAAATSNSVPSEMLPTPAQHELDAEEHELEEERRKHREPVIVFKDIDAATELEALVKLVDGKLTKDDETAIEELHQYLIQGEGSWALGEGFLAFVGRILDEPNVSTETRVHLLRTLATAALRDDVILLLHQDRRDHVLMNYAHDIDRKAPEEQEALALFVSFHSRLKLKNSFDGKFN